MPTDPNQPKKPTDPNQAPGAVPPTTSNQTQQQSSPQAAPQPARPTNPPLPGTGPNGPTNPQATPVPTAQQPQQFVPQQQGSGYVNAQRYMDLLGPTFQQQAAAKAQAMSQNAAATQGAINGSAKLANDALDKQDKLNQEQALAYNPTYTGLVKPRMADYSNPAGTLKDYMTANGGTNGGRDYAALLEDSARYGDQAQAMGSDSGLASLLQSQGVAPGAMSDYDAAMLGMGTTGFGDNSRKYGDLLGNLGTADKQLSDRAAKAKADFDKNKADYDKMKKKVDLRGDFEKRRMPRSEGAGKSHDVGHEGRDKGRGYREP